MSKLLDEILSKKELTLKDLKKMSKNKPILHNPTLITDGQLWCETLHSFSNKDIVIFGDYDCDGICSDIVLQCSMEMMNIGKNVNVFPADPKIGYGLSIPIVDSIIKQFPTVQLIITVDNGIACKESVDYALEKGINVLISDHHPSNDLNLYPDNALCVVNVNRTDKNETYPFKGISGTTTIWKLMKLYESIYFKGENEKLLDMLNILIIFCGISTISDVMPLEDENKTILNETIQLLREFYQKCLKYSTEINFPIYQKVILSLKELINFVDRKDLTIKSIGWKIAPLLNSEQRYLKSSSLTHDVFLNNQSTTTLNDLLEMKTKYTELRNESFTQLEFLYKDKLSKQLNSLCVLSDYNLYGSAGVLASRFVNRCDCPVAVFDRNGKGSIRSPKGYILFDMLELIDEDNPHILETYGGHANATGVKINPNYFKDFSSLFNHYCEIQKNKFNLENSNEFKNCELLIDPSELLLKDYYELNKELEILSHVDKHIFMDNVNFVSIITNRKDYDSVLMGKDKNHLKLVPINNPECVIIIWSIDKLDFNIQEEKSSFNVIGNLNLNEFRNTRTLQLISESVNLLDGDTS